MGLLILGLLTWHFLVADGALVVDLLKKKSHVLVAYTCAHPILAVLIYLAVFTVTLGVSLPTTTVLTVGAGMLFGQPWAMLCAMIGATAGACLLYLIASTIFGRLLQRFSLIKLNRLQDGFKRNAASYLLCLRLSHLVPFELINLAGAFFAVRFRTYLWTTVVGILPGVWVEAQAGATLRHLLSMHTKLTLNSVFPWELRIALFVLALLALLPILIKKLRKAQ